MTHARITPQVMERMEYVNMGYEIRFGDVPLSRTMFEANFKGSAHNLTVTRKTDFFEPLALREESIAG